MSWKSIFGSELNLSFLELALALAGSSILMLCAVLLFFAYNFFENDYEINIFFDRQNYNLIGWQTMDIYQNLSITYLNSIIKNQKLKENLFELPSQN